MAVLISAEGTEMQRIQVSATELGVFVAELELAESPRWVWASTADLYPGLLAAGVKVARCHDLRLCHQILSNSAFVTEPGPLMAASHWVSDASVPEPSTPGRFPTLFDIEAPAVTQHAPESVDEAVSEFARQREAVKSSTEPGRLSLLLAAESVGALVAAELSSAGIPWDTAEHDRILSEALGPRPATYDAKPAKLAAAGTAVREALRDPNAALDSPPKLLRALRAAGIDVASTSQWELAEHTHPALAPLLTYKKLARLLSANGWAWLDEWVHDGRYRPVYVPGGVVTGRWASSGGGALQLPRQLRPALRADPGWKLIMADVSQLEPRVLAAISGDEAMARAGRGRDLYSGIVESGSIESRADAKLAMLGAMYGATSGDSGRLVPRLRRVFPAAMRLVDEAASIGERGGTVSTWLGRSSPPAEPEWREVQSAASLPGATRRDEDVARRTARDRGRFTRNFVVQGTAAEWALAWLGEIRRRLTSFPPVSEAQAAYASGPGFSRVPHLAFFLHDEIIVHAPEEHAEAVAEIVRESADTAGRILFGHTPVDFRLDLRVADRAATE
ncbi:bifunctional 3'-5' exonuclease/DNA polymerase [Leucobacter sp. BZR 635]